MVAVGVVAEEVAVGVVGDLGVEEVEVVVVVGGVQVAEVVVVTRGAVNNLVLGGKGEGMKEVGATIQHGINTEDKLNKVTINNIISITIIPIKWVYTGIMVGVEVAAAAGEIIILGIIITIRVVGGTIRTIIIVGTTIIRMVGVVKIRIILKVGATPIISKPHILLIPFRMVVGVVEIIQAKIQEMQGGRLKDNAHLSSSFLYHFVNFKYLLFF